MTLYRILLTIILVVAAARMGLVIGDRSTPTRIERTFLLTPSVVPGGELLTRRTVYRERLCHTTIERYMLDSRGVRFDLAEDGLGTIVFPNGTGLLGRETFIGKQTVPPDMAPGPAKYVALTCYRCNWSQALHPVCEPAQERTFTVAAPR